MVRDHATANPGSARPAARDDVLDRARLAAIYDEYHPLDEELVNTTDDPVAIAERRVSAVRVRAALQELNQYEPQPEQPGPGQPGGNPDGDCTDCQPEGDQHQ